MKTINRDILIEDIINTNNKCKGNMTRTFYRENGKYSESTIIKNFGSWNKMLKELKLPVNQNKKITEYDIIDDLKRVYDNKPISIKMTRTYYNKNGIFSSDSVVRRFGTWENALNKANIQLEHYIECNSKEDIIDDVICLRKEYGYITSTLYRKYGKFKTYHISKFFGSWKNLTDELGIDINEETEKNLKNKIDRKIIEIFNRYGYVTTSFILGSGISVNSIVKIYGSLDNALNELKISNKKFPTHQTAFFVIGVATAILNEDPKMEYNIINIDKKSPKDLKIDAFFEKNNIALEYDGVFHELSINENFQSLEKRKENDKLKNKILKENGIKLIRISYKDNINIKTLKEKIKA